MKYIITKNGGFAIFDDGQTHAEIAKKMDSKPVSGGFVFLVTCDEEKWERGIEAKCYGQSVSLGLMSQETDSDLLSKKINR